MNSIPIVLAFVGLIVLCCGIASSLSNLRSFSTTTVAVADQRRSIRVAAVVGLVLALVNLFIGQYPIGPALRIVGVPFMAATVQQTPDGWLDVKGPLTGVVMAMNALTSFVLPQLFVRVHPSSLTTRDSQS
jgi:hypothetical protein